MNKISSLGSTSNNFNLDNMLIHRKKKKKRGPLMILISILDKLDEGAINKTHLSYKANLDIRVLNRYLHFMQSRGLVYYNENDPTLVSITDKGKYVLQHFRIALRMIDEECDIDNKCILRAHNL